MNETQNAIEGQPQPKYRDRLFIAIFGKDSQMTLYEQQSRPNPNIRRYASFC